MPWYSSCQKKSVLLSVVQHEANYILSGGQRQGVSRTALDVSVCVASPFERRLILRFL